MRALDSRLAPVPQKRRPNQVPTMQRRSRGENSLRPVIPAGPCSRWTMRKSSCSPRVAPRLEAVDVVQRLVDRDVGAPREPARDLGVAGELEQRGRVLADGQACVRESVRRPPRGPCPPCAPPPYASPAPPESSALRRSGSIRRPSPPPRPGCAPVPPCRRPQSPRRAPRTSANTPSPRASSPPSACPAPPPAPSNWNKRSSRPAGPQLIALDAVLHALAARPPPGSCNTSAASALAQGSGRGSGMPADRAGGDRRRATRPASVCEVPVECQRDSCRDSVVPSKSAFPDLLAGLPQSPQP